jgi:hypothetical protein
MRVERSVVLSGPKNLAEIPAIAEFANRVLSVEGVRCVVAEIVEDEEEAIHITTFSQGLSDATCNSVYALEGELIDSAPSLLFDFHLRNVADELGGTPEPSGAELAFAVWGSLDENSRRAPQTSKQ